MKVVLLFSFYFLLFTFSGCGYKPSSHYAKNKIKGKVYVDVDINLEDPKNTVLIKDAMNEVVVSRFKSQLVYDKLEADTLIKLKLNSVSLKEIQYDKQGYVKLYRATVSIKVIYKGSGTSGTVTVSGSYDFTVDDDTVISDTKRFEAIKVASSKALEEITSKFAIESFKKGNSK